MYWIEIDLLSLWANDYFGEHLFWLHLAKGDHFSSYGHYYWAVCFREL